MSEKSKNTNILLNPDLFTPETSQKLTMPLVQELEVETMGTSSKSSIEITGLKDTSTVSQLHQPLQHRTVSCPDITEASTSTHEAQGERAKSLATHFERSFAEGPSVDSIIPNLFPDVSIYPTEQIMTSSQSSHIVSSSFALKPDTMQSATDFPQISSSGFVPSFLQSDITSPHLIPSVKPHWMFEDHVELRDVWYGFSEWDSEKLENAYKLGQENVISTDGGRCDVFIRERMKTCVYYLSEELFVARCTWFFEDESRFVPYDEHTASFLEENYQEWMGSMTHEKRFTVFNCKGSFIFEKPSIMLHSGFDGSSLTGPHERKDYRIVKRGLPDRLKILPNESPKIDHLLLIVPGIGSFCDLRFRTVSECVDGFRDLANNLVKSHFKEDVDEGRIGRVEILPVAWHTKFRTSDIGLDKTMKRITLPSIPKLRHFTNDTLIDILLYNSQSYSQGILDTVAEELNKSYETFMSRNPEFSGQVFVAGHSLGSLIIFDVLSNQSGHELNTDYTNFQDTTDLKQFLKSLGLEEFYENFKIQKIDLATVELLSDEDLVNLGLPIGPRRKLMNAVQKKTSSTYSNIKEPEELNKSNKNIKNTIFPPKMPNTGDTLAYPRLNFHPSAFFALGSPIAMFLATRGFDQISENYRFPTCPAFFHIFHPYDPVAFRIEPLIDPLYYQKPVLIPHHKGRKRLHLELKDNMTKITRGVREKVVETFQKTMNTLKLNPIPSVTTESKENTGASKEIPEKRMFYEPQNGNLNRGKRIDYVLQEKPIEALNDYLWALTSHATYWNSEDTVLLILKEIYACQGLLPSFPNEQDTLIETTCPPKEQKDLITEHYDKTDWEIKNMSMSPVKFEKITIFDELTCPLSAEAAESSYHCDSLSSSEKSVTFDSKKLFKVGLGPITLDKIKSTSGTFMPSVPSKDTFFEVGNTAAASSCSGYSVPRMFHSTPFSAVKTTAAVTMSSSTPTVISATSVPTMTAPGSVTPPSTASAVQVPTPSAEQVSIASPVQVSPGVPGSQHIGPPPLSGFVKKSPFSK